MNKAVIIGGDHHNGLNLARILGRNGIEVHTVIISESKHSFVNKSKFVKSGIIISNEYAGLDYIKERFLNKKEKTIIIPYSDGVALALDKRLNEFSKDFIIPSIKGKPGKIVEFMDKGIQNKFASENDIKMANSLVTNLNTIDRAQLTYPCIVKPLTSAYGIKSDIGICNNYQDFEMIRDNLLSHNCCDVIIQDFLNISYEIVIVAAFYRNGLSYDFAAYKVIRSWPKNKGTSSYAELITNTKILKQCEVILNKLNRIGYAGLADIELFNVNDEIYFNEVNWRNSGSGFRGLSNKYDYAAWWCFDAIDITYKKEYVPKNKYSMVEYTDIRHVIKGNISLNQWLVDRKKTSSFSLKYKKDMKPYFWKYVFFIFKIWGF